MYEWYRKLFRPDQMPDFGKEFIMYKKIHAYIYNNDENVFQFCDKVDAIATLRVPK